MYDSQDAAMKLLHRSTNGLNKNKEDEDEEKERKRLLKDVQPTHAR